MAGSQDSATATPTRALAAVMFSDVANYTLIMGRDERKGLELLDAHRALLKEKLPKFGGRIVGEAGDGTVSSFSGAVDLLDRLNVIFFKPPNVKSRVLEGIYPPNPPTVSSGDIGNTMYRTIGDNLWAREGFGERSSTRD